MRDSSPTDQIAFTQDEILTQLDACARDCTFPMLDNGYVYPADVRLTALRDERRWALIIEVIGFFNRCSGHDCIQNALHKFGNCLDREPGTSNDEFLSVTADAPEGPVFDEAEEFVHPDAQSISIRGQVVPILRDPDAYTARGIELEEAPKLLPFEALRALVPEHRDLFLASSEELMRYLPADLPVVLRLDEWHHPDLANDDLPRGNDTFRMIADVLVSGNPDRYKPTARANTHWKNWPEGGAL